ncbi:hypothetical protein DTV46_22420 [Salmonella enterica subsp. salamae]|nr:hypothetical protein [Salmonella enterica subsp. salamae]ECH8887490.1 hypothetical protein [Salmonella enterica subsp. enterica]
MNSDIPGTSDIINPKREGGYTVPGSVIIACPGDQKIMKAFYRDRVRLKNAFSIIPDINELMSLKKGL